MTPAAATLDCLMRIFSLVVRLSVWALLTGAGVWVVGAGFPAATPSIVHAQADSPDFYIEPGVTVIRDPASGAQTQGKVMIDRRTGDVWGFPTASGAPYPVVAASKEPPVSKAIHLGRFDLASARVK